MIQDVLRSADPEAVTKYQEMSRMRPFDEDTAEIVDLIIEEGLSAWMAAKRVSLNSNRSLSSLYYRARVVVADMMSYFAGVTVSDLVGDLVKDGQVRVPGELTSEFRKACEESEIKFEEWSVFYIREEG